MKLKVITTMKYSRSLDKKKTLTRQPFILALRVYVKCLRCMNSVGFDTKVNNECHLAAHFFWNQFEFLNFRCNSID